MSGQDARSALRGATYFFNPEAPGAAWTQYAGLCLRAIRRRSAIIRSTMAYYGARGRHDLAMHLAPAAAPEMPRRRFREPYRQLGHACALSGWRLQRCLWRLQGIVHSDASATTARDIETQPPATPAQPARPLLRCGMPQPPQPLRTPSRCRRRRSRRSRTPMA